MQAASYSGSSVVPASSWRRSVSSTSGGKQRAQTVRLRDEVREGGRRIGEDERAQPWGFVKRVLLRQETAPGLAEDVMAVGDPERVDEAVQFSNEQVDGPEVGAAIRIVSAAAVAELVVVDDGPRAGEVREGEQVVVRRAGAAVEHDERRRSVGGAGSQIARHAVPGLPALAFEREGHGAFACLHGSTLRSSA